MGRRRIRLVPPEGLEALKVRIVLYFDDEGDPIISYVVDSQSDVPMHEALGVVQYAAHLMMLDHVGAAE